MSAEDTVAPKFYSVWPNTGKKFSQQLGEIRTDTSSLTPVARAVGFDAAGDWSDLDGIAANSVQAYEIGQDGFHNRFRTHYNKTDDLFEIASNTDTENVPNWYTVWTINNDGYVTQLNTPTTASNVGGGAEVFKTKVGVDLVHRTLTATSPITLTENANTIDVDGSVLVSTYSSDQAAAPSGDANVGVEIILSDTGKVGNDLPFKAIKAGPNVVVSNTGTAIQIESTAQVVEFYGIRMSHSDGGTSFPEVHHLIVNREDFYLTQETTSPSNKTIILNSISDPFNSSDYVAVIGDDMTGQLAMHNGTAAEPSIGFTEDNTMGLYRNAANDLGVAIGGAAHTRFLSDRLFLAQDLQITAGGSAASPDIYFFPDSDTGVYQPELDSIGFTTGGTRAGYFTSNQDFYVTGRVLVGNGSQANPSMVFGSDQELGLNRESAGILNVNSAGAVRLQVASDEIVPTVPVRPNFDGTNDAAAYSWDRSENTGLYLTTTPINPTLQFVVDSQNWLEIQGTGGSIVPKVQIRSSLDGTAAYPMYSWNLFQGTGLYRFSDNSLGELGFATGASGGNGSYAGHIDASQKWWFANDIDVSSGDVNASTVTANTVTVATELTVPNATISDTLSAGRVEAGIGNFYTSIHTDVIQLTRPGSNTEPAIYFGTDRDTGIYGNALDNYMQFSAGGWTNMTLYKTTTTFSRLMRMKKSSTAAAPSLVFNLADYNTGFWQPDAKPDEFHFAATGVDQGYFHSGGMTVWNDVMAGRVEAGIGKFYTTLITADDPYSDTDWDGDFTVPTKNAVRDAIIDTGPLFYGVIFRESEAGGAVYKSDTLSFDPLFYLSTGGDGKPILGLIEENIEGVASFTAEDESSDAYTYPIFVNEPTGVVSPKTDTRFRYNSTVNELVIGLSFIGSNYYLIGSSLLLNGGGGIVPGEISDISGAISFKNENLSTTGTLASGALTATTGSFTGLVSQKVEANNVTYGAGAGESLASGANHNTCVGFYTGTSITTADDNTFIGSRAGALQTTGDGQVAIGFEAGMANNANGNAVVIGYQAGKFNTSSSSTFIGYKAGAANIGNSNNTYIGYQAGHQQTTGAGTVCIGANAGSALTTAGDGNIIVGKEAGLLLETGTGNTLIGNSAGSGIVTGDSNTIIGTSAGTGGEFSNGTMLGSIAGRDNTGTGCTFIGASAGRLNTGGSNTAVGDSPFYDNEDGVANVAIGRDCLSNNVGGDHNIAIGYRSLRNAGGAGDHNVAIGGYSQGGSAGVRFRNITMGYESGKGITTGADNVIIGHQAGLVVSTTNKNTILGNYAGYALTGGSNVFLGYYAGRYQVATSDKLIIDNRSQGTAGAELTDALIVGDFHATPSSQVLTFNANTTITYSLRGTPDEITATDAGVAASITTINTEVTTNGDSDLDNVTLANGTSGQIKHIYCVVEGNAADTWKITPATMVGGTQITFAGVGEGCTLVYADNEGWCIIANNGGTVT